MPSSNDDGPKAILSSKEREMLRGDGTGPDLTDQARWKRHSRIRDRLRWAIYDFGLLYDNWDDLKLEKVFDEEELHPYKSRDGISRMFSTFYRGLFDNQLSFRYLLIDGIVRAESGMNNRSVDVRFDVDPRVPGDVYVNDAAERINPEQVDSLRIPEMRAVLEGLAHSGAEVPELVMEGRRELIYDDEEGN